MSRRKRVHEFELPTAVLACLSEYFGHRKVAKLSPERRQSLAVQAQVFANEVTRIVANAAAPEADDTRAGGSD
jgi:hypothetical protein